MMVDRVNAADFPDRRDGSVYLMPESAGLAVDVALATGRPLLLRGEPGSGKSSLAAFVARERGWRYYEHVVTSVTQAQDLLWSFDSVRRLADAQAGVRRFEASTYIDPGVLWWAFARESALRCGSRGDQDGRRPEPFADLNADRSPAHAVVLIDEIDKADPDLPNGLLVPLSANSFFVTDLGLTIRKVSAADAAESDTASHLIVITTNEERELPEAFLRRCIVVWLETPDEDALIAIAKAHLELHGEHFGPAEQEIASAIARELVAARSDAVKRGIRPPSTAEYLDALRACRTLGIEAGSPTWEKLRQFVLIKPQQPRGRHEEQYMAW